MPSSDESRTKYDEGVARIQAGYKKHSIKVDDEIYQALLAEQRPRETFDQVIKRVMGFYAQARVAYNIWIKSREEK